MIPNQNNTKPGHAKWFGLINDVIIPMPGRRVAVDVIRAQASIAPGDTLFRDHDAPRDEIIGGQCEVDLGLGNVFYSENCGCADSDGKCDAPAKLAFAVDDRSEVTIRGDQTGKTLRALFGVGNNRGLYRDLESPVDQLIADDEMVLFDNGPVFITRPLAEYCINIEGNVYPWDAPTITVAQIRMLGGLPADQSVVVEDGEGHERTLGNDEVVRLSECCRAGRAPKYKRG